jgi:cyanidin-3-O-glucoside 2''-O-glucuronosyltransferase
MFPWLAHGHINPFLELAKELTHRNFIIYFCSTPILLKSIKNKVSADYSHSIKLVELDLPSLPELPPHRHTTNGLPPHLMRTLKTACEMSKPNFSNIFRTFKPDLYVADVLQPWSSSVAASYNVPEIPFLTSSAAMITFFSHMILKSGVDYPFPDIHLYDYEIDRTRRMVSDSLEDYKKNNDAELENRQSSGKTLLIKSLNEVEGKYLDYFTVSSKNEIMTVGSLVQDPLIDEDEHSDVIEWLNQKEEASTVFVSFGSEYFLSNEDLKEIAQGLEISNVNFIWVIRFPAGNQIKAEDALPDGFIDRVKERGLVVEGWAPQVRILYHKSTGGFVSHCGWGSVMESIKFGVPIIAMPMHLDQPLNARLVVEVGIAMEVMRDSAGKLHRDEVAKVIRQVVVDKEGEDVRKKASELSDKIRSKGTEEIDIVAEKFRKMCVKD